MNEHDNTVDQPQGRQGPGSFDGLEASNVLTNRMGSVNLRVTGHHPAEVRVLYMLCNAAIERTLLLLSLNEDQHGAAFPPQAPEPGPADTSRAQVRALSRNA